MRALAEVMEADPCYMSCRCERRPAYDSEATAELSAAEAAWREFCAMK